MVGGYIFLAGVSGAGMIVSGLAGALRGPDARSTVRNGRYLSMLAPVIGSPLLIWDLHTPQRFYNMMRIAKHTSPMSIGTWILTGLSTYTATLLSATSTPYWAAAPRMLATRFAASSTASGAAALALLEPNRDLRRRLEAVSAVALAVELGASLVADRTYEHAGVGAALKTPAGRVERIGVTGFGILLPLGLQLAGLFTDRRTTRQLGAVASAGALLGSCLLRISTISIGIVSAKRPDISFRFSQAENLPDKAEGARIREKMQRLLRARNKR